MCDVLRDYEQGRFQRRLGWVIDSIAAYGFDVYTEIIPSVVYWPIRGELPRYRTIRAQRVTPDLVYRASVIIIRGGNGRALLQSFRENQAALGALRWSVDNVMSLLLTWYYMLWMLRRTHSGPFKSTDT